MANEKFRVKYGLAVGDNTTETAMSVDGTTGDITTQGDINVNGGDIKTTASSASLFNDATALTVSMAGSATTVSIGANTGTTTINNSLVADDISVTTVDTTNLEVSNIKAKDGTAAMTIANSSGAVNISSSLQVDNIDIQLNTISATDTNGSINLTPNGTGSVRANGSLDVGTIRALDGTAAATVANSTGVITVSSQLNVDNINISTNTISSTNTNGNINLTPNGTGTVVIPTADITNLDVTNIRALDGTAAATIANSTGIVTVSTELNVDNLNISGNTISSTNTNGDILITPNGTGDIDLVTDTVQVGDANATATITTNGTGDLVLNTNNGTNAGSITLTQGTNGNITLTPNGTGTVIVSSDLAVNGATSADITTTTTTASVFNTTATTLNIGGAATTTNIGTTTSSSIINGVNRYTSPIIYSFAGANNYRGLMISNGNTSSTPLARTGVVVRTFPTATQPRGGLIFENARGTETSPTALQGPSTSAVPDFLGEISAGGRSSTGWINDLVAASPLGFTSYAAENWVAATNVGVGWALQLQPTATTLTAGGASRITTIDSTPQGLTLRGDTHGFSKGKTIQFVATGCSTSGTTLTIGTVTSGTVAVGSMIQNSTSLLPAGTYIIANISGSGNGSTWTLNQSVSTYTSVLTIAGQQGYVAYTGTGDVDVIGDLTIRGNDIKGSTGTSQIITSAAGATLELRGDNIQLENAAGTSIVGSGITYNRVYGQFEYNTTVTPVAINTAYVFPLGSAVTNNIATVASTSRLIPGAAGVYNIQFSAQVKNDNSQEHTAYIFLVKNGTAVTNSTGQVTILRQSSQIVSWNYIVTSANTTDYWEIGYAVDSTQITFPAFASTAFAPSAASMITTITPVGA